MYAFTLSSLDRSISIVTSTLLPAGKSLLIGDALISMEPICAFLSAFLF